MLVKLPGTHAGIAEPLLCCGRPGSATLTYIKLLPDAKARVGIEFWGLAADQGPVFSVGSADAVLHIDVYFPALFPPSSSHYWDGQSQEIEAIRLGRYYIVVNGKVQLAGKIAYAQPPYSSLYVGINPIGGSVVSSRFTGTVLSYSQH